MSLSMKYVVKLNSGKYIAHNNSGVKASECDSPTDSNIGWFANLELANGWLKTINSRCKFLGRSPEYYHRAKVIMIEKPFTEEEQ
jgi:hypothetical protein